MPETQFHAKAQGTEKPKFAKKQFKALMKLNSLEKLNSLRLLFSSLRLGVKCFLILASG
jgi:hypothetical protein